MGHRRYRKDCIERTFIGALRRHQLDRAAGKTLEVLCDKYAGAC
jgi:hypothetical protein